jgi:hypothetical protein
MSEVFQDGEPVDSVKLSKMQADIASLRVDTKSAYDLSQKTSTDLATLTVTHTKAYRVEFENGLNVGLNTEDIEMTWTGYQDVYLTATPRGSLYKHAITWSISGGIGNFKLHVQNNTKNKITGVKFDVIAAGTKPAATT